MAPEATATAHEGEHLEPPGVSWRVVVAVAGGFLAFVAAMLAAVAWFYGPAVRSPPVATPAPFPAPRLQRTPSEDYAAFAAEQRRALAAYAWIDRAAGLVRIPVDRAEAIIAAKGAAAFDPLDPPLPPTPRDAPAAVANRGTPP